MLKNFLIVGTQRTGSTVLYNSLNLHPDIACGAEWTQRVPSYKKVKVAQRALAGDFAVLTPLHQEWIAEVYHQYTRWLGFKSLFRSSDKWLVHPRFSLSLRFDRFEDYVRWMLRRPDVHIIHIVRCDAIEWLKSKYMADATGSYWGKQYPVGVKIEIPLKRAIKRLHAKNTKD